MSDNQQLVSELVIKGFLPLVMLAALMYGAYLILDRQMTHIEQTQASILNKVIEGLDAVHSNQQDMKQDIGQIENTQKNLIPFLTRTLSLDEDIAKGTRAEQLRRGAKPIAPRVDPESRPGERPN